MAERQFDTENISLNLGDDEMGSFGVTDTTTLPKDQLDSFLMSDSSTINTDSTKIKKADEETDEEKAQKAKLAQNKQKQKSKTEDNDDDEEDLELKKSQAVKSFLEDDEDSDEDSEDEDSKDKGINKKTPKKSDVPEEDELEDETFSNLSNELFKLGVFSKEENEEDVEISSPEEFLERFNMEKQKGAVNILENFLGKFGEEYREMFDSVFVKGVNPKDYVKSFNRIQSVSDLDLTNVSNQEKVFREYYRQEGFSDEKIERRLEKAKDYGDLEEESKDLHEVLIEKEKKSLAKLEEEKAKELEDRKAKKQVYQSNVGKILQAKIKEGDIDGIPMNVKEANELFGYMTNEPYKLPNGELITELQKDWLELDRPENHELKIKVAAILKAKGDLSKIKKRAVSKESNSMFNSLTHKKKTATRTTDNTVNVKSFFEE